MHKQKPKIGRRILLAIVLFVIFMLSWNSIKLNKTITIKPGDTFQVFVKDASFMQKFKIKTYLMFHRDIDLSKLEIWSYIFSGKYSKAEFLDTIVAWPRVKYQRITVLEWRSIYDIDANLTAKWLITTGQYLSLVTDPVIIKKYTDKYSFLSSTKKTLTSLEWFLYPDTYNVDVEKNPVDQLVYLQLEAFKSKVWNVVENNISSAKLNWRDSMIMASIVEKEERNDKNKPVVAGILINRLKIGMRIDADITLCYWYKQPYETCTPNFIVRNLNDTKNPYNTRQQYWLPPQPIANPSLSTIQAVLNDENLGYIYYLHDMNWQIHYAKTTDEHTQNKNMYLK